MKPPQPPYGRWLLALMALAFFFDRITKTWVVTHLRMGDAVTVVPRVLSLTRSANYGGNFGVLAGSVQRSHFVHWGLTGINALIPLVLLIALVRFGNRFSRTSIGLALAVGGTLGNLYDRFRYGAVVDFIGVNILSYHWPDFNLADMSYLCGFTLLLLDLLLQKKALTNIEEFTSEATQPNPRERAL
jgi:signal peptidase II